MKRKTTLPISLFMGLFLLSALPVAVSHAQSIDAAEITAFTCDGFTIGTSADPGTVDFTFEIVRTDPPGPVVVVTGSLQQTVPKPGAQFTPFSWGDFSGIPYVLADGTLEAGDYDIPTTDIPVFSTAGTATLSGFNTIPLHFSEPPISCADSGEGCRFTGGGVDTDGNWDHALEYGEMLRNGAGKLPVGIDRSTFGGQAGASTALPPQPSGEWTHHNQKGPSGRFTFHGGTSSAPMGTEIDEIRCSDPGGCKPSGNPPSPAKQLDFDGIGTFKSIGKGGNAPVFEIDNPNVTAEGNGNQTFDGTFHWFEVNIDDLGEPGGENTGTVGIECPDNGFGEKGDVEDANCVCPDFYRITIYNGVNYNEVEWLGDGIIDPTNLRAQEVIYEFYGYIDGGNLQIHQLTGGDR